MGYQAAVQAIVNAGRMADEPRDVAPRESELRGLLSAGELELPLPRAGRTPQRWAGLANWGRRNCRSERPRNAPAFVLEAAKQWSRAASGVLREHMIELRTVCIVRRA